MKPLYILLGFLFLGIGIIGTMIPVLPTVPFLLAASFFFTKSSKRLNDWFISTNIYQKHLKDFVKKRSMTLKAKVIILAPVSCMLIAALIFSKPVYAKALILLVMIFKYYYFIFKIKTLQKEAIEPRKPDVIACRQNAEFAKGEMAEDHISAEK